MLIQKAPELLLVPCLSPDGKSIRVRGSPELFPSLVEAAPAAASADGQLEVTLCRWLDRCALPCSK